MLKSHRVKLRAIEEGDLSLMAGWRNQPQVYDFFYEYLPVSVRQQRNWYERQLLDSSEINFIISNSDDSPVGTVSIYHIDRRNRKAEWGRFLIGDPSFRSSGIGAEIETLILQYAFDHLNLQKLYCEVLASNERVVQLHKSFGFVVEGTLRDHIYKAGKYMDVVIMAMFASQYETEKIDGRVSLELQKIQASDTGRPGM